MFPAKGLLAGVVFSLAACSSNEEPTQIATSASVRGIPNSANCASVGGIATIARTLNGDVLRMCQMPNGKQCEELALRRGACASVR